MPRNSPLLKRPRKKTFNFGPTTRGGLSAPTAANWTRVSCFLPSETGQRLPSSRPANAAETPTSDDVPLVLRRLTIEDQRQCRGVQLSFAKQSTRSLMKIDATDCWRRTTTSSILPTLHIPNSSACSCVEKDDHSCIRSTLHQDTAE